MNGENLMAGVKSHRIPIKTRCVNVFNSIVYAGKFFFFLS